MRNTAKTTLLLMIATLLGLAQPVWAGWEEGRAFFAEGAYTEAAREFQAVTETHPNWASGYFMLGQSLGQLKRSSEALAAFRKAHELEPENPQIGYALGKLYAQLERDGDAHDVFSTVSAAKLSAAARADFYETWAIVRNRMKEAPQALDLWGKAVAARPDLPRLQYNYGVALFNAGLLAEAVAALEKAVAKGEPSPEYLRAYARALKEAEFYPRAVEAAGLLVAKSASPDDFLLLGEAQLGAAQFDAALASFAKADDSAWLPHFYAGQAHFTQGQVEAAETQFEAALERVNLADDERRIWADLARVYSAQERYNEAARAYAEAGDDEGVKRAQDNQQIVLDNLKADAEQDAYEEILRRQREIQAEIDRIRNGRSGARNRR